MATVPLPVLLNESLSGTSTIAVGEPATHFLVTAPNAATAGLDFNVTVTALDSSNNTAYGYVGTVNLTSSDTQAVFPSTLPLTYGLGVFSVTLMTPAQKT